MFSSGVKRDMAQRFILNLRAVKIISLGFYCFFGSLFRSLTIILISFSI
jgi:hypothetical protein